MSIAHENNTFFLLILSAFSAVAKIDSLYLFAYGTAKNDYHNGLHYAWSQDQENWIPIGPEYSFLRSDYGRWGSQKRCIILICLEVKAATGIVFGH